MHFLEESSIISHKNYTTKELIDMKHTYLTQTAIKSALAHHDITKTEAKKLIKKVDCQVFIFKSTHI